MSYDPTKACTWDRAAAIAERERLYNEAARQMSSMSERAGVSLTLKQQNSILEQFGAKKTDISGMDARAARQALENDIKNLHYSQGNMRDLAGDFGKKEQLEAWTRVATVKRTTNDEAALLQRFAQQHNIRMSRAEAKLILEQHPKILSKNPAETLKIIKNSKSHVFRAAKAGRAIGTRALAFSVGLGARIAGSVDSEDTGLGKEDAGAAGKSLKDAAKKASEKSRLMAKEQRLIKQDAARARYRMNHTYQYGKKKGQVKPRIDERWETRMNKVRQIGNKDISFRTKKTQAQKMRAKANGKRMRSAAAERMRRKQRADTIRRLVAKNKAKAKAAKAAAAAIKKAITAIISAITSAVTSTAVIAVVVVFGLIILIILLIVTIVSVITALLYSPPMGDWYDPQGYKYVEFIDATQDMQAKYYNDCMMMAYRYGVDAPTPEECAIDWGEVYTLWAAIVNYRSENDMMAMDFGEGNGSCAYTYGGMFITADDSDATLFKTSGDGADDYIQDLYLAFYFMYYDLRGMDEAGNPFLVDITNGDRYIPNYASDGTAGGYDFSSFNEESGYPLRNVRTNEVITNAVCLDDNMMWAINTSQYPNLYFSFGSSDSTGGNDGGDGYICRGYPLISLSSESFSTSFSADATTIQLYGNVHWSGTKLPTTISNMTFSGLNISNNGWSITSVRDSSGANQSAHIGDVVLSASSLTGLTDSRNSYSCLADAYSNCSACNPKPGMPSSIQHTHDFYGCHIGYFVETTEGSSVSYDYAEMSFVHRTALEGLAAMHDAYLACYGDYYATHSGSDMAFNIDQAYIIDSSNRTAVEAGTMTGHDYDEMLLILNQIFDRNNFYPWPASGGGQFVRQGYANIKGTHGSWDCYEEIAADITTALNSKYYPTDIDGNGYLRPNGAAVWLPPVDSGPIPMINWRAETNTELWFEEQCGPVTGHYWIADEAGTGSIKLDIIASIIYSEDCWPFKVWDTGDEVWMSGQLNSYIGTGGVWNNNSYLMYRWLTCEKGLTPQTAAGCLGALYHETNFASPSTVSKDINDCWAIGLLQWNDGTPCADASVRDSSFYETDIVSWCSNNGYNWENAGAQLRYADYWLSDAGTGRGWVFNSLQAIQNGQTAVTLLSASSRYYSSVDWTEAAWGCYYWAHSVEICSEGCGYGADGPAGDEEQPRMKTALSYLYYIENSDPNYLSLEGTELSGGTVPPEIRNSTGEAAVEIAKSYLGTPYVFGGSSYSGIDCSGLTMVCYAPFGYSLPHGATMQCDGNYGTSVSVSNIQIGDLVYYQNSTCTGAQHAAIYVGDGQVIHASSSRGSVVYGYLNMMPIRDIKHFD